MAAMNLKASPKGVTALVIIAVVILFGCVLVYVGMAGSLKSKRGEMLTMQKQVDESREIAQKLEQSKLQYLDSRSQVRYLEASVSTQEYVPTLLKQIEYLGRSVNLKVMGVRPAPPDNKPAVKRSIASGKQASEGNLESASTAKADGGKTKSAEKPAPYDEIKVEIEAEGRYMNVLDFLYKLTSFPKIVAVNEVEMSPPNNRLQSLTSPTLGVKLNVTAFVLKSETAEDSIREPGKRSRGGVQLRALTDRKMPRRADARSRREVAGREAG